MPKTEPGGLRRDTILTHAGRHPDENRGFVNPPVYHASTILFPSMAFALGEEVPEGKVYRYGRLGTPTSESFEEAVAAIEGAAGVVSVSSGLAAITLTMTTFLKAGDHVLVTDSAYRPTRNFGNQVLSRYGISVEYYDPAIGAGIADLIRDTTRVIYLESPGSMTFEVQDVPAITEVARRNGILTMIDNTWATPYFLRPFDLGVDISIHAGTKYFVGHSDAMIGAISCASREHYDRIKAEQGLFGQCAGPDDLYLAQRGMRTMSVRLKQHQEAGLMIADWLQGREEVDHVRHPGLPGAPGHDLWTRDFTGATGLFSFVLKDYPKAAVAEMMDHMDLFGMGASWGGYESLILPGRPDKIRTATTWPHKGFTVRLHIGLEDPADLIDDLSRGFDRLRAAVG